IVERWEVAEITIEYGKEFARCVHNILYTIVSGTDESCRCKKRRVCLCGTVNRSGFM
ncbi:hypothetical protein JG687_00007337, partial [Phytophthora cactorum]